MDVERTRARALQENGLHALITLLGGGSPGARVHTGEGIRASIVPATPTEPDANVVAYESPHALARALPEIAEAYAEAGVKRWEVFVPESEHAASDVLRVAGYQRRDALPAMYGALSDFRPLPLHGLDYDSDGDVRTLAQVNALAYGRPEMADIFATAPGGVDLRVYQARVAGEPASVLCTIDVPGPGGLDCAAYFVATVPDARTVGLAPRLLSAALVEARERGCVTCSGQASAAGARIYERMGFQTPFHFNRYEGQER